MAITRYWLPTFQAEEDKSLDYWVDEIEKDLRRQRGGPQDLRRGGGVLPVLRGGFQLRGLLGPCGQDLYRGLRQRHEIQRDQLRGGALGADPGEEYQPHHHPRGILGEFRKIQYHMDEPLADPAAVALYFVCNTAAQHLKVVRLRRGADESLRGYNIYKEPLEMQWYDKIPSPSARSSAKSPGPARPPGPQLPGAPGQAAGGALHRQRYMFTEKERQALLKHPTGAPAPEALCKPYYDMVRDKDPVTRCSLWT